MGHGPSDCRTGSARQPWRRRNKSKGPICLMATLMLAISAAAQLGAPAGGNAAAARSATSTAAVSGPSSISPLLTQIQETARTSSADVSLLNLRKWKVGNDVKNDAITKAEAIQRNLTVAMPSIVSQVQASPDDLAANFKLYRNLGVLYDVMSSLAESAGAFGSKNEFEALAADLNRIDRARHSLGDRLETLASAKDAEILRLRSQLSTARTASAPQPKKIIVDEDVKKPVKKTPKKKPKPAAAPQTQPAQASNPQ